jgi:hypothetical protein
MPAISTVSIFDEIIFVSGQRELKQLHCQAGKNVGEAAKTHELAELGYDCGMEEEMPAPKPAEPSAGAEISAATWNG